jgi:hypothetical protein
MPMYLTRHENRVRLCLAAVLAVFGLAISADAAGQSALEVIQPEFVPRQVLIARPFRVYADPGIPAQETGLRDLSLSDVEGVPGRFFARDERYNLVDFTAALVADAREPAHEETIFIAQQSARLGHGHHQAYNLASAVSEFTASLEAYARTTRMWTRSDEIGEVWLTLARVRLELAQMDLDRTQEHLAHADEAFRNLIRVDSDRRIDETEFPSSVVGAYRRAYLDHILDDGAGLRISEAEARRLGEVGGADVVVYGFVMTDDTGHRLVLQAYDVREGRFLLDHEASIKPTLLAVSAEIEASLSRLVACHDLIPPPIVDIPRDQGTLFLSTAFSVGTYTTRPTDRLFANLGAKFSLTVMLRETFGLTLSGIQWTAPRDPDGELLRPLESTRGSLGILAGGRAGDRLRAFATGGLDLTRIVRLRATDSFWCKVSEGETFEFDDERRCRESELVDEDPRAQLGLTFGLGTDLNLTGPFWLHLQVNTSIYTVPLEDRRVNFPLWLDIGLTYELGH